MSQVEPPLVRELRTVLVELREKVAVLERQIDELRGAVVALMEPGAPRILRTPGGIMVLDKKVTADGRATPHTHALQCKLRSKPAWLGLM